MPSRRTVLHVVAIALVTLLAYSGSFDGAFVSDDVRGVQHNELLHSLDWEGVKAIVRDRTRTNYIPVTDLSLALDYLVFGPEPFGFHVTNLILHTLCALLVYRLLLRFEFPGAVAFFASLLWAVHPLNVESVAFISERKNVLSTFFFLSAFLTYLRFSELGRPRTYALTFVLFLLALLSKMNTMVLPAVCIAYEVLVRSRLRRRDWIAAVPMLVAGIAVSSMAISDSRQWTMTYYANSPIVTWLSSTTVVFRYLRRVFWPTGLQYYYLVPLRGSLLDPTVTLSVLGLLVLLVWFVWLAWNKRREAFWIAWFALTLSPMLNIVPFPSMMQDRYMYVPMVGVVALLCEAWVRLPRSRLVQRLLPAAAAVAIVLLAGLTHARVEIWDSPRSLWTDGASNELYIASDSGRGHPEDAERMEVLRTILLRAPESPVLHNNLGAMYFEHRKLPSALEHLEKAAKENPRHPVILLNLGRAYLRNGDLDKAREALQETVRVDPYSFYAHLNLARIYLAEENAPAARAELDSCAELRPFPALWALEERSLEELLGRSSRSAKSPS